MKEIPKIIHQIWSEIDKPLPNHFKELGNTWKEHHPTWEYEFWDDNRMNTFIQEHYPQYWNVYNNFPYHVQRWDAIRYLILDKIGGMYVDFDYEALESLESLFSGKECCFSSEPEEHLKLFNKDVYFNNALMASVPEHPFIQLVIANVFNSSPKNGIFKDKMTEVLETTGPLLLTNLYEKYGAEYNLYIIPSELVSPFSKMDTQYFLDDMGNEEIENYLENKLNKAIAVHYFIGSWI